MLCPLKKVRFCLIKSKYCQSSSFCWSDAFWWRISWLKVLISISDFLIFHSGVQVRTYNLDVIILFPNKLLLCQNSNNLRLEINKRLMIRGRCTGPNEQLIPENTPSTLLLRQTIEQFVPNIYHMKFNNEDVEFNRCTSLPQPLKYVNVTVQDSVSVKSLPANFCTKPDIASKSSRRKHLHPCVQYYRRIKMRNLPLCHLVKLEGRRESIHTSFTVGPIPPRTLESCSAKHVSLQKNEQLSRQLTSV
ncbi:hypothetical protein EGR_04240 [Echinococcus granulosus]|uniref:Uncharacterized protein n=1 Tax=Echinococcus granulosus TaxID=6210 RepID=W6V4E4_ECHGR|nr:hypothetical protein EGR_04240 [Echinococcus granulosus]EUB60994.1 hypothetical protein EGR_04240 [Echinococcus granulosus]